MVNHEETSSPSGVGLTIGRNREDREQLVKGERLQ
jgi:hypothetical protein